MRILERMKFRFEFLVRLWQSPPVWRAGCAPALVAVEANSQPEVLDLAREELTAFGEQEARAALYRCGGNTTGVRCPQGTINLLADRWFCKVTGRDCPIGAELSLVDLEASLTGCNAGDSAKEGVRGALRAGYPGLHHHSGTWICPRCRDKGGYRAATLRNEWELQSLGDVFDDGCLGDPLEVRTRLITECGSVQVLSTKLCAACFREVVEKAFPAHLTELHVIVVTLDEQWS
jgi:hypothetical protein